MATRKTKSSREDKKHPKKVEEPVEVIPAVVETVPDETPQKVESVTTSVEESPSKELPHVPEEPPPEFIYDEPILTKIVVERYEGPTVNGLYDGEGKAYFTGGNRYKGQFSEGLMHGNGTYVWTDGVVYAGEFFKNQMTGFGVYFWTDGSAYEGEILHGLRHGVGVMKYANGMTYSGDWINGKQSGKGRLSYNAANKSYYEGDWVDNVRHGTGTRSYPSGNVYEGTWYHDVRHGQGTMYWYDQNQSYSGQWENGVQHGIGEWTWHLKRGTATQYSMHNTYHGQIHQGQRHGYGIFYYANGARYEGQWKHNTKSGKGKFIFKNGRVYEGIFKDDRLAEFPEFKMDSCCTPDLSQIRTRTPLPSEMASRMSALSANTVSPSFRLDVDYLLMKFEEADREEEATQVMFVLLRHLTNLHRIYSFYSRLGVQAINSGAFTMTQMQFWRFLKDCKLHHLNCGLTEMDRWLARDPDKFEEMHDPSHKVLFREFLNHLVVLAFHLYNSENTGSGRVLAASLSRLIVENVLKNACMVKGYFFFNLERAAYVFDYQEEMYNKYKMLCTPRKSHPQDQTLTMRQFLLLMKDFRLLSKDLTAKAVVDVLAFDDPKVRDPQGSVNLEHEMGFLDFFEALIGCAEIFVTEAVFKDPNSSIDESTYDLIRKIQNTRAPVFTESQMSQVPLMPGLDSSQYRLNAENFRKSLPVNDSARESVQEGAHETEEMERLVASYSFANRASFGDLDKHYGINSMSALDEDTITTNYWTHQVKIFVTQRFLPACERFFLVQQRVREAGPSLDCQLAEFCSCGFRHEWIGGKPICPAHNV